MTFGLGTGLFKSNTIGTGGGSFLSAWSYKRTVTVDNTGNAAKTDYPVKISLTTSDFDFANAETDAADIRLADGTTLLSHWVQDWDSGAETGTIWVNVPTVPANDTTTIDLYYGNASAVTTSDITAPFIFGDDFTDLSRILGQADQTYTARNNAVGVVLGNRVSVATQSNNTWKHTVREQSNIIHTPSDIGKEYKFYFTGRDNTGNNPKIGLAYASSVDGPWTEYASNPVIAEGEDPYVCRNIDGSLYTDGSGNMHLFCEDTLNQDMLHYYSADGLSWTADPSNPVITRGAASAWDELLIGSPIAIHLGSNEFLMVYEGRTTGPNDRTGIARKSGNLDGTGWTKDAGNPISTADVPDDLIWTGSQWIFLAHQTSAEMDRYATSEQDTTGWDSATFSALGPNPLGGFSGASFNAGPDAGGTFGKKMTAQSSSAEISAYDVFGTSEWAFERLAAALSSVTFHDTLFEADGSTFVMDPNGKLTDFAMIAYTKALTITNDFAVMFRRKAEVDGSDDALSQFAFGTGVPTNSLAAFIANFPDGYHFFSANPGAGSDFTIREYGSGSLTGTLATGTMSAAQANNYAVHQASYLNDGSMAYTIDGSSIVSVTDTTHLSSTKQIMFSQGNRHSGVLYGAKQTVDWVAVRKYDGEDPSTTVGSETAN